MPLEIANQIFPQLWKYVFFIALGFIYTLLVLKGSSLFLKLLGKLTKLTSTDIDNRILKMTENPLKLFLVTSGVALFAKFVTPSEKYTAWIPLLLKAGFTTSLFWFLYNAAELLKESIRRFARRAGRLNAEHIAEFLIKVSRFAVILIGVALLLQEFGINVTALLASLGLGGLAVALAAKDTLSNILGGITIIADNPFAKGDWVLIAGKYEGIVEGIGLRSTKLRTFEESLLTLPNSLVVNSSVENFSRRKVRRVKLILPFERSSSMEGIIRTVEDIRNYLLQHPRVAKHKPVLVYLDGIGEYSYDVLVYFFADTADWKRWLELKQEWISQMVNIAQRNGVSLAIPSYRIFGSLKGI